MNTICRLEFSHRITALAVAFSALVPVLAAGQSAAPATPPAPPPPSVYVNPRSDANDPRIGLKAGLYDAGTAALGMQLLIAAPKPAGFRPDVSKIAEWDAEPTPPPPAPGKPRTPPRISSPYGTTNSDLAFAGKTLLAGNYYGVNFYDISDPAKMKLTTSMICPGGQGDVSVYGHLMFMSVEAANGRLDCGTQGFASIPPPVMPAAMPAPKPGEPPAPRPQRPPEPAEAQRIRGIRIFDISDITQPRQIADVQTCRGSHTHTLLIDPKDKDNVYIYISGSAGVRDAKELPGCSGEDPTVNPDTALFTIVVVKVPLAHPELAKVVSSPRIFMDSESGNMNGLWKGGNHGEGTQTSSPTRGCHDITVYSSIGLAAGACSGNGILLDISDPVNPKRIDAVSDPNYAFWHSANFSNDGSTVLFTDEWGGGGQPRCRSTDPMAWGADAIFTLKDRKLTLASYYKMPAPQTEFENCVAHNGSMIPVPGRNIEVQSWYQGGASIVDYTDPSHPVEIGYFDRGPVDGIKHAMGGQWSTYWYNGYIYGSEIARGIDVWKLTPTKFLSQNEIDAANQVMFNELNVQNQPKVRWPASVITAKAYLDQLERGNSVPAAKLTRWRSALGKNGTAMKKVAPEVERQVSTAKSSVDATRLHELATILAAGGKQKATEIAADTGM